MKEYLYKVFAKRLFDLIIVVPSLLILIPVFISIAVVIKASDWGPVLFKQQRVGLNGEIFNILKFRTMIVDAEKEGAKVTTGKDTRITWVGKFLRKSKLDELPQLGNVLIGNMSLVGPRPEVPEYVAFYSTNEKEIILSVLPGITDNASIEFRDENEMLTGAADPVDTYREKILPIKIKYYIDYVKTKSLWGDFKVLLRTFVAIIK